MSYYWTNEIQNISNNFVIIWIRRYENVITQHNVLKISDDIVDVRIA